MRNVIVVIGSVTRKQYQSLRLKYVRKGIKVRILRVETWQVEDEFVDDNFGSAEYLDWPFDREREAKLNDWAEHFGTGPGRIIEVVCRIEDFESAPPDIFINLRYWPQLKKITFV